MFTACPNVSYAVVINSVYTYRFISVTHRDLKQPHPKQWFTVYGESPGKEKLARREDVQSTRHAYLVVSVRIHTYCILVHD